MKDRIKNQTIWENEKCCTHELGQDTHNDYHVPTCDAKTVR